MVHNASNDIFLSFRFLSVLRSAYVTLDSLVGPNEHASLLHQVRGNSAEAQTFTTVVSTLPLNPSPLLLVEIMSSVTYGFRVVS